MDNTALLLVDRVQNSIRLGESYIREFKSAFEGPPSNKQPRPIKTIVREIAEQLICFANADGGDLLIGVEDDGRITGVPHDAEAIDAFINAPKTGVFAGQILPIFYAVQVTLEEKRVLFFSVGKGTDHVYQLTDGRCVRRKDRECLPVTFGDIHFERQEIRSREFERQFVDGAAVNDLDLEELQIAANSYIKGLSVERYLQQVGLSEYIPGGLRLRMAALLLYAKDTVCSNLGQIGGQIISQEKTVFLLRSCRFLLFFQSDNRAGQAKIFVLLASQDNDLVSFGCKRESCQGVGEASVVRIDESIVQDDRSINILA